MPMPIETGPVWADWVFPVIGLRVVAATDQQGLPWIGTSSLGSGGEMMRRIRYRQCDRWRYIDLIDGTLWKFWAVVTPSGLRAYRRVLLDINGHRDVMFVRWNRKKMAFCDRSAWARRANDCATRKGESYVEAIT